ncbi:HipA family kinase [Trichococcus collinsii]|uniref:HipA-like kinase domain-containing protein n=1 Tax=Trichococcus collinsii TaxID=157076 RepID=A0AB37ZXN1_9LACT|nr:HipA family kinase [Trichococcus collinsii]CZR03267.1 Hypothetical protein Tcol_2132 [Trichococcus collinsii]SDZ99003.1 hypothetical protein SAMN04488525_101803 [Trichococcus collinsii]
MHLVNHIREIENGVTRPSIAEAEDGKYYVIKYLNDSMNGKGLFNEYVAYQIGQALDIPMPKQILLDFNSDFINRNEAIKIKNSRPCQCIASEYRRGNCNINPSILKRVENHQDIPGIILFDQIILNNDRSINPGNLYYDQKTKRVLAIDHSHIFINGLVWDATCLQNLLSEGPQIVPEMNGQIYKYLSHYVDGHSPFHTIQNKIHNLDLEEIRKKICAVPDEWGITSREIELSFEVVQMQVNNIDSVLKKIKPHFNFWKGEMDNE